MLSHQQLIILARSIVREVRATCVIGSSNHPRDLERTGSDSTKRPWSETSVIELTKFRKYELQLKNTLEIKEIYESIASWLSHMSAFFCSSTPLKITDIYSQYNIQLFIFHENARAAKQARCGNCGEQASLAFILSLQRNIIPSEYFYTESTPHCFVVWNRPKESNENDITTWKGAIIIDAWDKDNEQGFYEVDKMTVQQRNKLLGSHPDAYPKLGLRVEKPLYQDEKGDKTEKPNIPLSLLDVYYYLFYKTQSLNFDGFIKIFLLTGLTDLIKTKEAVTRPVLGSAVQHEITNFFALKTNFSKNFRDGLINITNPNELAKDFYEAKNYYESFYYTLLAFHPHKDKQSEQLEKFKKHAPEVFNTGTAAYKKNEFETAQMCWQQALRMFSYFQENTKSIAQCHSNLASSYRELYDYDAAIKHCDKALKIYELLGENEEVSKVKIKNSACEDLKSQDTPRNISVLKLK